MDLLDLATIKGPFWRLRALALDRLKSGEPLHLLRPEADQGKQTKTHKNYSSDPVDPLQPSAVKV